jgi:glucan phosphoethanolaminetransferase (alkaline phosphatase superfamily)
MAQLLNKTSVPALFTNKFVVMKQPVQLFAWRPFLIMLFLSLFSLVMWAQTEESSGSETSTTTTTKKTTVSVTTDEVANTWYTSPWVWIVGAAVFILLLVALLSNRGTDTVRVSKTVERNRHSET